MNARVFLCYLFAITLAGCIGIEKRVESQNLKAAQGLTQCILSNELDKLGQYLSPTAINHAGRTGDVVDLDSIRSDLSMIHRVSSNLHAHVIKEVADGEYVFQWIKFSGTSTSPERGGVGKVFESTTLQILRFENGLVMEHWEYREPKEVLKMLSSMK